MVWFIFRCLKYIWVEVGDWKNGYVNVLKYVNLNYFVFFNSGKEGIGRWERELYGMLRIC